MPSTLSILPLVKAQAAAEGATTYSKPVRCKGPGAVTSLRSHMRAKLRIDRAGVVGTVAVMGAELPNPGISGWPSSNVLEAPSLTRPTASAVTGHYDGESIALSAAAAVVTCTRLTHAAWSAGNIWVRVRKMGQVAKTGTVAATAGDTTLAGTNTLFTKELEPGMYVADGNTSAANVYVVKSIESDTSATLMQPVAETLSGATLYGEDVQWLTYNASAAAASTDDDFKVSSSSGYLQVTIGCARYTSDKLPIGTVVDIFKGTPREVIAAGAHLHENTVITPLDLMWVVGVGGGSGEGAQSATDVTLESLAIV